MWAQWGSRWWVSAETTATQKTNHVPESHADFYKHSVPTLVHFWWKCIANADDYTEKVFCSYEFALSNSIILLFPSVVISIEINTKHYFQSNLCTFIRHQDHWIKSCDFSYTSSEIWHLFSCLQKCITLGCGDIKWTVYTFLREWLCKVCRWNSS